MNNNKMYSGYRYPSQVISHTVWLYFRFTLSFRDIEELLAARSITVSYETIRQWCQKFGQTYSHRIKKSRGPLGDTWYLDEVFIKINGVQHFDVPKYDKLTAQLPWLSYARNMERQFGR